VSAFEKISREHLIDPKTGQLNVAWLPENTEKVASRDLGDIMGRVLGRDKNAGSVLTEADFLPKGTKPGVTAGIPPGKFAVTVPASGIPGLEQLRNGDRFDLMIALTGQAGDNASNGNTEPAAVFGGIKPPSLRVSQLSRQHGVKRLVTGGQLVALLQGNQQSTKGSRGLASAQSPTYAEIAIDEEEIGPLTEAISLNTPMTCIVRSGRPEAETIESFTREGLVPVITTAMKVAAYSELTDEALIDDATGQLHFYYFPADRVPDHWLTDPTAVYGRVVSRTLRRGSPITEADLLPAGTKPGISAGVPSGMVAMAVNTSQISGFGDLVQGDHFAIHAKIPESSVKPTNSTWVNLQGGSLSPETERLERMLSTGIREVVPQAIYLRNTDDGTATIAVPDDRITEVAQLIRDKMELFVVARSAEDARADRVAPDSSGVIISTPANDSIRANDKSQRKAKTLIKLVAAQADPLRVDDRIEVPILTRDVEAFEPLAVDDFIDPATGQIRYVFFPSDRVRSDWVTDVSQLIDRVTARALKSGRTVSANDLAPPGSPAGPSAGVPEGMVGVLVDSAQIEDLDLLRPTATFSIVSGRAVQPSLLGDGVRRTLSSNDAIAEADKLPNLGVQISRTVASDALLLAELGSTERTRQNVLTQRVTTTRTTIVGGVEEVQVDEQPRAETETRTVTRFAIAVPKSQAATLISFLNRAMPLRVVLDAPRTEEVQPARSLPAPGTSLPSTSVPSITTYIREHFSGSNGPTTEVFVSDRNYPAPVDLRGSANE
ncbi:MAG: hypothetical protein GY904_15805, partial [Planctomycetaceae bacterium]|nr:hypothetical protein [Planctomycetaceae bacterium]